MSQERAAPHWPAQVTSAIEIHGTQLISISVAKLISANGMTPR